MHYHISGFAQPLAKPQPLAKSIYASKPYRRTLHGEIEEQ
jgi:hypothetical protein